jgi:rRNA-processing protein FCF1
MKEAVIDTSSIIFGLGNGRDIFDSVKNRFPGFRILISEGVLRELDGIAHGTGKRGECAKTAIELIKRKYKNIKVDDNTGNVDEWILAKSLACAECVFVTNDTALYRKVNAHGAMCFKLARNGLLR